MLTRFLVAGLLPGLACWAAAHESRSANFRNLSGGAATSAAAVPAQAAPAPRPVPAARAAPAPRVEPAPPPEPAADASSRLWLAAGAGAALAFLAAFLLARRRGGRDDSLALAAHELKSPLSAIEAYLALMEADGRSGAADARAWLEDVRRMRGTAAHLRKTIGDMLEMTRLEDGRLRVEARPFDLAAVAAESAAAYRALAQAGGVRLAVEGGPAPAWGDPARARQILDNLVGNALRHAASEVRVSCAGGPRPSVRVSDDGAGVPAQARPRLFQRFARLSQPRRGDAGTGLGLYIGRRIAEASGGALAHAPGPDGRGAAFTLTLPGRAP